MLTFTSPSSHFLPSLHTLPSLCTPIPPLPPILLLQVLTFAARPELSLATEIGRSLMEEKKKHGKSAKKLVKKTSLLSMSRRNIYGGAETEVSDAALLLADKGIRDHPIHHEDSDDLYELNLDTKDQVPFVLGVGWSVDYRFILFIIKSVSAILFSAS